MKTISSLIILGFSLVALTGCYTQVVISNDETYQEPEPIVIILPSDPCPCPKPIIVPAPPHHPTPPVFNPNSPKEKIRPPENPTTRPPSYGGNERDPVRNSGSRNNTEKRKR